MSGEPPIEFRAAKRGLSVSDWLAARLRHDATICTGAAALLLACGAFATLVTFLFVWGVLSGALCGVFPWWFLMIPATGVVAALFVVQRKYDGDHTEPIEVNAGARGLVTLRLSRLTGNSWLLFLDRPQGEPNPVVRFVTNLVLLGPRLFAVGRLMWRRSRQMKSLDIGAVAGGLDALMQATGRVPIGDLLQDFAGVDPQRFISDLTSIDGVILLASDPPGLTLTPSVAEDYEAWKRDIRKRRRAANS